MTDSDNDGGSAAATSPPMRHDAERVRRGSLPRPLRWIIGALAAAAISIATLLMIEGAASAALFVRDYTTATSPGMIVRPHTEHDTLLGWINRPSVSVPNEYGRGIDFNTTPERFRGRGALAPLAAGRVRFICSGDSFTMGSGVSDEGTWCAEFQRLVPSVETVNMGQGGYGADQVALWYRRDGVRVPHQVQVLALTYVQFERALVPTYAGRFKPYFSVQDDGLRLRNVPVPRQTMAALRRAYATRLVEQLRVVQAIRRIPRFDGRERAASEVISRFSLFEGIFDQLDSIHRANGTQLVIAYLPTKREARPSELDERRRRVAAWAARRDVPFVDLTAALRTLPADSLELTFISRIEDGVAPGVIGHYTSAGGTWAARELAKAFTTTPRLRKLIPAPPRLETASGVTTATPSSP